MTTVNTLRIRANQWMYRIGAYLLLNSVPLLRKGSGEGDRRIRVPAGTRWEQAKTDSVRSEWIFPPNDHSDWVLLYLHGGGGVTGLYNAHRWMVGHITLACGFHALLPDYSLAPEHPFPAGLNDCISAYQWLLSNRVLPQHIIVAGDSMGGLLTISVLLILRQLKQPLPCGAICLSPNTDPTFSGKSMQANALKDALLSPKYTQRMMGLFLSGHDITDPLIAPLHANLKGLPPILIQVGGDEILLDDSIRFSERAKAAGVDVTLEVWPHMWHVWHTCVPDLPEANQAIDHIGKFVKIISSQV
jgi:monoterpene epsilon-lactone hydrolase